MSQLFTWGGQSTGGSALASTLPKIPGLISFRMDWLDLLAIQGILKSLFQHHSSKASILQHSAFFTVQLSHPYMTTGKTIALTRQTFVGKVMSLLFNMLSRLVITLLPRSKHLLISWLQSPSAVILEPPKIKSNTVNTVSRSISHGVIGPDAMIFVFWMLSFKPTFSLSSFTFIKRFFSSSSLSAIRVISSITLLDKHPIMSSRKLNREESNSQMPILNIRKFKNLVYTLTRTLNSIPSHLFSFLKYIETKYQHSSFKHFVAYMKYEIGLPSEPYFGA